MLGSWSPNTVLLGIGNGVATTEDSTEIPQNIKNKTMIRSKNPTLGYTYKRIGINISKRYPDFKYIAALFKVAKTQPSTVYTLCPLEKSRSLTK